MIIDPCEFTGAHRSIMCTGEYLATTDSGGDDGIRTHEALLGLSKFPAWCLRPLGHISFSCFPVTAPDFYAPFLVLGSDLLMAGKSGLEPLLTGSEPVVLPLDDLPIISAIRRFSKR